MGFEHRWICPPLGVTGENGDTGEMGEARVIGGTGEYGDTGEIGVNL